MVDLTAAGTRESRLRWFTRPPAIATAFGIGVAGFALALYTLIASRETRELRYSVHPIRTTVLKTGQATGLQVSHRGREIKTDLTAVQIAVWNAGKLSIRPANVLSSIRLRTTPTVPILESSIRFTTRPVVSAQLADSTAASGAIDLGWKILERNDGFIVQVLYAGGTDVVFSIDGIVEGQSQIRSGSIYGADQLTDPQTRAKSLHSTKITETVFLTLFPTVALVAFFFKVRKTVRERARYWKASAFVDSAFAIAFVTATVGLLWALILAPSPPPFPF